MSGNPLLELIRRGESGAAGYNAYNRGTYVDSDGTQRIRPPDRSIDFSQLTLGQVLDLQHAARRDPDRLFAVGKYQIIPQTMDAAVARLGLDRDQRFTPQLQDRVFSEYLIVTKRPAIHDYIVGKPGVTLEKAQYALACEWASFGDPNKNGKSHYGGANHASITLAQSAAALNEMRSDYRALVDRGIAPEQAWKTVAVADPAPAQQRHPSTNEARPAPREGLTLNAAYELGIKYDDVKYGLGAKNLERGRIDCAGWVKELQNATMMEVNRESGRPVFGNRDLFATTTSDQMIRQTVEKTGVLHKAPLTPDMLKEGMIIGENNGKQSWEPAGRYKGIDHITMVVRDPSDGRLMISQSRGGEGVEMIPLDRYLQAKQGRGVGLYATDPLAKARELIQGQARTQGAPTHAETAQARPRSAGADGVLQLGEKGADVTRLQETLRRLGYRDAEGKPLLADGDFGERTRHALQAFQREHGLQGLGVAGPKTQELLRQGERELLTHAGHPQHGRYLQVLDKVHAAEAQRGIKPGPHSEQLAGALTVEAVRERLERIDRVELNAQGTLARAVQVNALRDEPALNRSTDAIGTQQAMSQSIAESSQQARQVATNVQLQQQDEQRLQASMPKPQAAPAH
ncbi:XVIPCD domain-containing protein [Lysobacter solisilvae (ex Woo and Kim 2020)]|uniref:Peptidoglycan-binding protein n=1 Tax=Agrilutibacter terrestris TaxID=2865112 RepID=A0A7H0FU97_9GAMM|nr:XVIPCD domain-containing protein [Lysobacter terrestris]QNP39613.1 peptidoglycan-binding protein [Lysobacter terrestris]